MPENLTEKMVARMKPKDRRYVVRDKSGLALRVSPAGKKTWLAIYQMGGQRKWFKLGEFPGCDLREARRRHRDVVDQLDDGIDPSAAKAAIKAQNLQEPIVDDLIEEYMEKWAVPRKRSWKTDRRILDKEVSPLWGSRKVKSITKRDAILLLEGIVDRGSPTMSNKVLAVVRRMFNFAVERDILEYSPFHGIKPLGQAHEKDRFLTEKEIRYFWNLLSEPALIMSDEVRRALKLVLVTAQRPGECIGINRKEVDGRWWTIPAERSKNGKAHRVYLTDLALSLLTAPPRQKYFFLSPRIGKARDYRPDDKPKAIDGNALPRALGRNFKAKLIDLEKFTPHDLRRTAATHMVGLGVSVDVVSRILNHTDQRITAIYNRHSYAEEIQTALEKWSNKLMEILKVESEDD